MNKTCPKCGADYNGRPAPNQHDYWCGSTTWGDGDFYQSPECVRRERDQLVERIKRLEEAGVKMAELLDCYGGFNETEEWACSTRSQHIRETRLATEAWAKAKGQP